MVMCACVCKWLCVCVNIVLYKDVYIVGPPRAFLMRCHHAVRVGGCVNDPVTCVLKMMLSYRTSWNLRHVTMGSGVGGCVNVPGTCVLKMMLLYRTSWNLRHVTMRSGWAGVLKILALAP